MARSKRPASKKRRLHRSLGVSASIFIILIVLTGLMINHSNHLGLDQRHVSQPFLLSWYGLGKPENINSYAVGDNWLSFAGSQLYFNEKPVSSLADGLGAVLSNGLLVAAGNDELLLLDGSGQLIERLPWDKAATQPVESIGLTADERVVVKSGSQIWLVDRQFLGWKPAGTTPYKPVWSLPEPAPANLLKAINRHYRGKGPSLEQLLLDIHSGRFFGPVGMLVYDLLALALAFLAISGLILWFRGRRNGKRKLSGKSSQ